jgi:hypothetical protein
MQATRSSSLPRTQGVGASLVMLISLFGRTKREHDGQETLPSVNNSIRFFRFLFTNPLKRFGGLT